MSQRDNSITRALDAKNPTPEQRELIDLWNWGIPLTASHPQRQHDEPAHDERAPAAPRLVAPRDR